MKVNFRLARYRPIHRQPRCLPFAVLLLAAANHVALSQPRSPVVSSVETPVRSVQKAEGHWFIDFGRAAFGNVVINSAGDPSTNSITIHLGEAISDPQTVNRSPGGTVRYQRQTITLKPGEASRPTLSWKPPGWMKSGFLELPAGMEQVMPFRYVEIEGAPATFDSAWVKRISYHVAFDETTSSFTSSSHYLNDVWDLCKYSIKATSFLGLYVDGDRERMPYEADALINQLSHYCVDHDYTTARLTHEYLLSHPTWPTEWRLQSVLLAWEDFLWSGDDTSLRANYDTLKSRAMLERRTTNGLFRGYLSRGKAPWLEDIVDWPAAERDGYDMSVETKTVVTAFHYRALALLEKIAAHLDKPDDARKFADLAKATSQTFNEKLWNEAQGCYWDGLNPDTGDLSKHASSHANFFPLALGLVPADRIPRVAEFLKSRGMVCSVYGAQFYLEALYAAGEADFALKTMTSNEVRSWRNMTEKVGSTITLEAWDPSLKPNLDWNHAWGAAPANIVPRCLMGIEPVEAGFKRFRVRPQTANLTSASVKVPTPQGPISLSIENKPGSRWKASIDLPANTIAEFHLPPHQSDSLALPPDLNRHFRFAQGRMIVELQPGHYEISAVLR